MAISDVVVGNLLIIYVAVIAGIKAYGLVCGRSFGGWFVLMASTTVVGLILVGALTWDVSRKATQAISGDDQDAGSVQVHDMCKGGICWHGVAVRFPASQLRFSLPQQIPYGSM
ncbi:hypothetical protein ERO13_A06G002300v2 [Gossypium hirsutum]|uniref:Uncharacterized protein n=6 Tax=Gossypium TaxID=3633 RepID=A0A2P5WT34_GOSBA|nr:uncharacterized protein LOC107938148 [Gossypium hirsutum]XP_017615524.1 uncharacterized protein LOC108460520 [Gossypium arboreum]KAB2075906.1 hypothetical protein ES319_A06G002500v1 [Gossypium barbadense]TYH11670.1 hypothetical protein ES288_A06G003800v1 [Gossypium darwinii]TYI20954.1 hypothetical protein ES332_A06G003000v1 [Gossypium tomentosum]TYJ28485.1 hypothetical protein E1A91_A06G002200v1 [Gossypium mustelinum]KAG4193639.1 hypothetical protein ERO13_A06G002300v2 [Gossypium hirsutum]